MTTWLVIEMEVLKFQLWISKISILSYFIQIMLTIKSLMFLKNVPQRYKNGFILMYK